MKRLIMILNMLLIFFLMAISSSFSAEDGLLENPSISKEEVQSQSGFCENQKVKNNTDFEKRVAWGNPVEILEQRGCCSWHGGVCGCDKATGRVKCCDGTLSPTCRCD